MSRRDYLGREGKSEEMEEKERSKVAERSGEEKEEGRCGQQEARMR